MKKLLLTMAVLVSCYALYAQEFEVPKSFNPKTADDYAPYEADVIKSVDWLMSMPYVLERQKRDQVNAFLLKWITGSPNVHIEIKPEIVTFMGGTPDLLMIFMGGWSKYSLESKKFDDKEGGSLAGLHAVIDFYQNNKKSLPKDKNVEKYIKMKDHGELEAYVKSNC
ncbi:MAG: hypothetical protein U5K79_13885 [Cyclobacteriaceae bacterium]|nr:hypothetical protein [Cyclobacteriaceae bacterium]